MAPTVCGGGGSSFTVEKDETGSFIVSNAAQKSLEYAKRDVLYFIRASLYNFYADWCGVVWTTHDFIIEYISNKIYKK